MIYRANKQGQIFGPRFPKKPLSQFSNGRGVYRVQMNGKQVAASRFIWEFFNGPIPSGMQIDHANRDPSDNRLSNLRLATNSQNQFNRKGHGKLKKGVNYSPGEWTTKSYVARIQVDGKRIYLGRFETEGEAHEAYKAASGKLHKEFACQ